MERFADGSQWTPSHDVSGKPPRRVAFVFGGGGSRGAVQVGMVKRLREKGVKPDIVAGVSIGAVNAYYVAQDKVEELEYLWRSVKSNDDIYRARWMGALLMYFGLQWGYPSLLKPGSFSKKLRDIVRSRRTSDFIAELRVGAVDLITGDYVSVDQDHHLLDRFLLASMAIPLALPPVKIKPREDAQLAGLYVDGSVRNLTPLCEAITLGATEIHIFLTCGRTISTHNPGYRKWQELVERVIAVNSQELLSDDIERVLLLNQHKQVPQCPVKMFVYHTGDGQLPGLLDFDPEAIADSIDLGYLLAEQPTTVDQLVSQMRHLEPRSHFCACGKDGMVKYTQGGRHGNKGP